MKSCRSAEMKPNNYWQSIDWSISPMWIYTPAEYDSWKFNPSELLAHFMEHIIKELDKFWRIYKSFDGKKSSFVIVKLVKW